MAMFGGRGGANGKSFSCFVEGRKRQKKWLHVRKTFTWIPLRIVFVLNYVESYQNFPSAWIIMSQHIWVAQTSIHIRFSLWRSSMKHTGWKQRAKSPASFVSAFYVFHENWLFTLKELVLHFMECVEWWEAEKVWHVVGCEKLLMSSRDNSFFPSINWKLLNCFKNCCFKFEAFKLCWVKFSSKRESNKLSSLWECSKI